MKVLLVNSYDRGGAANACLRLHEGLLNNGIDSYILLKNKQRNVPNAEVARLKKKRVSMFEKGRLKCIRILKELKIVKIKPGKANVFVDSRAVQLDTFSYPFSNYDITESELYKEADIINLHWVAGLLDYKLFFEKNTKPIVWTLHDMNPFSGGEHYTEEIIGMDENGCPIARNLTTLEKAEFNRILDFKKCVFENVKNLHLVILCNWMGNEVKKSNVFNRFPVSLIPNGVNSDIFSPRDKIYSRNILGLPQDKKVILFVSDAVDNHRKGFGFLKRAFEQLVTENIVLCAIGKKNINLETVDTIIELGPIYDERLMSMAYSAADVFVIPSLIDNLPNTALESILCGTPVIGFPVGGIQDIIQNWENGLLAVDISVSALLETLVEFFNATEKFQGNTIRENALKKYHQNIQANNYIELFRNILKKSI